MDTNFTPLLITKFNALFTLAILWKRILPFSGLGNFSLAITSNNLINDKPSRKSCSISLMVISTLRRCELHHAVKVLIISRIIKLRLGIFISIDRIETPIHDKMKKNKIESIKTKKEVTVNQNTHINYFKKNKRLANTKLRNCVMRKSYCYYSSSSRE